MDKIQLNLHGDPERTRGPLEREPRSKTLVIRSTRGPITYIDTTPLNLHGDPKSSWSQDCCPSTHALGRIVIIIITIDRRSHEESRSTTLAVRSTRPRPCPEQWPRSSVIRENASLDTALRGYLYLAEKNGEMVTMPDLYELGDMVTITAKADLACFPVAFLDVHVLWARLKCRVESDLAFNAEGCRFPVVEV